MLQITECTIRSGIRPAQIGITRARRRIIVAQKATEMGSLRALVVDLDQSILRELLLDAAIPILHVRSFYIARDSMLVLRNCLLRIEALKEAVCRLYCCARIQRRQIFRNRERPSTPGVAP